MNAKRLYILHQILAAYCSKYRRVTSVLYTRKYYSDFLIREQDPSPARRDFPFSLQHDTHVHSPLAQKGYHSVRDMATV
jgi:hypothetical protein